MGIFEKFFAPADAEKRDLVFDSRLLTSLNTTSAGVHVSPSTALTVTTVWACVRVLAESVAQIPLFLYERDGEFKQRATEHPLYKILHSAPNGDMTAFHLKQLMMVNIVMWGNAYCEIVWSSDGQVEALIPLAPNMVTPKYIDGKKVFDVELPDGNVKRLPDYRIWHVPGLGFDGLVGYSPIKMHANSIGLAMATEQYGATFFRNGARPGLVLKHPGTLSEVASKNLKRSVEDAHSGLSNAHRVMVLEEGMGIETVGMSPEEAQFLSTREFQVVEIARIFKVPPHMVGDMSRATWANTEEMAEEFVRYTLMPYLRSFEATISQKLLVGDEQDTYFAEFLVDSFLRASTERRYDAYTKALTNGFMSINEVRSRENFNPIGGDGDRHYMPLNLAPVDTRSAENVLEQRNVERRDVVTSEDGADPLAEDRVNFANSFVPIYQDVLSRSGRREAKGMRKLFEKYMKQREVFNFQEAVDAFYQDFSATLIRDLRPGITAQAKQTFIDAMKELGKSEREMPEEFKTFIDEFLQKYVNGWVAQSKNELQAAVDETEEVETSFEDVMVRTETTRVDEESNQLAFEAMNALLIHSYVTVGIKYIRWVANPGACSFCKVVSGKVVGIERHFVENNSVLDALIDGKPEQMKVYGAKRHGPLHKGCGCSVRAEG